MKPTIQTIRMTITHNTPKYQTFHFEIMLSVAMTMYGESCRALPEGVEMSLTLSDSVEVTCRAFLSDS